jgi:predicted naringenin-chalcone synthase
MTAAPPPARLAGIGTALPPYRHDQSKIVDTVFSGLPGWDPSWAEVFAASGVTWRATVLDDLAGFYDGVPPTSERMRVFGPAARRLGAEAARAALARAGGGDPAAVLARVRDLLAVSCTGYHGPGLDVHLVAELGLDRHVRRLGIGHMGCYAALPALRTAAAIAAGSGQGVLATCVELCTLHLQPPARREDVVQFALFADGSPRVPALVERGIEELVDGLLAPHGLSRGAVVHWVVHPGGPEILERVHRRLALPAGALDRSWAALAEGGNRSSATVLFILDDLLSRGEVQPGDWVAMLAFGTGLTLDSLLLRA